MPVLNEVLARLLSHRFFQSLHWHPQYLHKDLVDKWTCVSVTPFGKFLKRCILGQPPTLAFPSHKSRAITQTVLYVLQWWIFAAHTCVWDGFVLCLRGEWGCCPPSCCSVPGESGKERLRWFIRESTSISYISLTTHGSWAWHSLHISKVGPLLSLHITCTSVDHFT